MKLMSVIFAILLTTKVMAMIEPVGRSSTLQYDGTIDAKSVEKHFINALNSSGSTIAAGAIVSLDLTADDGASVVTSTSQTEAPLCVMVAACAAKKLCKCQKYGIYDSILFDVTQGNAVAGKKFYMGTGNAGYVAAASDATAEPIGVFYDAATASGAVQVFLKL